MPLLTYDTTVTACLWTCVQDDRPFAGLEPPAAVFYFSRGRTAEHPRRHWAAYSGILQVDTHAAYGELYRTGRQRGSVTKGACWAHFRREVFELAEVARASLAAEVVQRIDRVFSADWAVNGCSAPDRVVHRQSVVAQLLAGLHA